MEAPLWRRAHAFGAEFARAVLMLAVAPGWCLASAHPHYPDIGEEWCTEVRRCAWTPGPMIWVVRS